MIYKMDLESFQDSLHEEYQYIKLIMDILLYH